MPMLCRWIEKGGLQGVDHVMTPGELGDGCHDRGSLVTIYRPL